jgi:predicted DNA-binding transcriptional regulator YafY
LDFNVAVTPELTQWVLGFGAGVEVIKPVELRQTIENESWKILGVYQKINPRKTFSKEKIKNKNL